MTALCTSLRDKPYTRIQAFAEVIGTLVSCFPGAVYGPLYYRSLEADKTNALKLSRGDYQGMMYVSASGINDLTWWIDNIATVFSPLEHGNPDTTIFSDASHTGYGFTRSDIPDCSGGGLWNNSECQLHINCLELKAALFALKATCDSLRNKHIRIMSDNVTTVAYIREMGGCRSPECNEVAKQIWEWAISHSNWISSAHYPRCTKCRG